MKLCSDCKEEKPLSEYYQHRGKRTSEGYLNPCCKVCHGRKSRLWAKNNPEKVASIRRRTKIKQKYNLSLEEYEQKIKDQNGVCAVCHQEHLRRLLNVDHNHTTGQVRGLLCDKCNMALGLLNDSSQYVRSLLHYIEKYE